jgi:hypothetical protein
MAETNQPEAVGGDTASVQNRKIDKGGFSDVSERQDEEFIKISANLPTSVVDTLRQVARLRGTTMTEVLRHAISLEKFLMDTQGEGGKVLIEKKDKSIVQVLVM